MEMSVIALIFKLSFLLNCSIEPQSFHVIQRMIEKKKATGADGGGEEIMWVLTFQKSNLGLFACPV